MPHFCQEGASNVGGEDNDGISEIDNATFTIRESAVVEYLQEDGDKFLGSLFQPVDKVSDRLKETKRETYSSTRITL